jgi:hypothetical protein
MSSHSRKVARLLHAKRAADRDAAFRAESTAIVAVALGFGYLAAALVIGAALQAWKGWGATIGALGLLMLITVLLTARRAVRAVRTRDATRV